MELTTEDAGDERPSRSRLAAYHEAGHLAVAWALQATLYETDIRHDPPFNGRAVYGITGGEGATVERIIAALAGPTAQRRLAPFGDDGGEEDREQVELRLAALCRHGTAAAIIRRHCQTEASRLVAANWDAVQAIAGALLEREVLTGDELNAIVADVAEARRRESWRELVARHRLVSTTDPRITR